MIQRKLLLPSGIVSLHAVPIVQTSYKQLEYLSQCTSSTWLLAPVSYVPAFDHLSRHSGLWPTRVFIRKGERQCPSDGEGIRRWQLPHHHHPWHKILKNRTVKFTSVFYETSLPSIQLNYDWCTKGQWPSDCEETRRWHLCHHQHHHHGTCILRDQSNRNFGAVSLMWVKHGHIGPKNSCLAKFITYVLLLVGEMSLEVLVCLTRSCWWQLGALFFLFVGSITKSNISLVAFVNFI